MPPPTKMAARGGPCVPLRGSTLTKASFCRVPAPLTLTVTSRAPATLLKASYSVPRASIMLFHCCEVSGSPGLTLTSGGDVRLITFSYPGFWSGFNRHSWAALLIQILVQIQDSNFTQCFFRQAISHQSSPLAPPCPRCESAPVRRAPVCANRSPATPAPPAASIPRESELKRKMVSPLSTVAPPLPR